VTYAYPAAGLDALARALAARCDIHYGKRAVSIDAAAKEVRFADGSTVRYSTLLNTLPLDQTMQMAGLDVGCPADPCTSVLVLNIGAKRGDKLPGDHWIYIPWSKSGFHRVGCYSHVDRSFVPASARANGDAVSLYIERAFAGRVPDTQEVDRYAASVVEELQAWGFIGDVDVLDPTWIDVGYTWAWPGSEWRSRALRLAAKHDIVQVGRYARWTFQGIADSVRDGLVAGAANRIAHGEAGTS
jgi:protoporphyrinogen oxidase